MIEIGLGIVAVFCAVVFLLLAWGLAESTKKREYSFETTGYFDEKGIMHVTGIKKSGGLTMDELKKYYGITVEPTSPFSSDGNRVSKRETDLTMDDVMNHARKCQEQIDQHRREEKEEFGLKNMAMELREQIEWDKWRYRTDPICIEKHFLGYWS